MPGHFCQGLFCFKTLNQYITMELSTAKSNIEATAEIAREASFSEKKRYTKQELTDLLLDKILEFKKMIKDKIEGIEAFIPKLEELSWYNIQNLDDDTQKKLNDVIAATKDWTNSLNRNYTQCTEVFKEKLTIEEMEDFRNAIDDLDEVTSDLEKSVFFYPNDEEFTKITKELKQF
jgi:hypothetical protein